MDGNLSRESNWHLMTITDQRTRETGAFWGVIIQKKNPMVKSHNICFNSHEAISFFFSASHDRVCWWLQQM